LGCALVVCLAALAGTAAAATLHVPAQYSTITAAITAANPGDTIVVAPGTYTENVVINKSITLAGAWPKLSLIRPAVSAPNPSVCAGASLCVGAESDIILVQADNVTIHGFTLDGNNPALTSGIVAGVVDLDARNGIITNHQIGIFNNLTVHHVTVKNIYLRGIYASSGGTFNFHDNIVQNVQADPSSIAMFNFGGSGTMALNYVSDANDAISSNWSGGTQYLYNFITKSGSGVHSDNTGGFGGTPTADLIQGNIVSNCTSGGYGIFVFVPYVAPNVQYNVVYNCAVGLAVFGNATNVTVPFYTNAVDGARQAGSVGVLVTSDELGYGSSSASVLFTYNTITENAIGVQVSDPLFGFPGEPPVPIYGTFHFNNIFGNSTDGLENDSVLATTQVNATCDWWGNKNGPKNIPGNPAGKGNAVLGNVTFKPWLLAPTLPGLKPSCTP